MNFPDDATLLARGKYATLGSERRKRMKELRERMAAVTDQARVMLRFDEDAKDAGPTFEAMQRQMERTGECLTELSALQIEMDALKPDAWGKERKETIE